MFCTIFQVLSKNYHNFYHHVSRFFFWPTSNFVIAAISVLVFIFIPVSIAIIILIYIPNFTPVFMINSRPSLIFMIFHFIDISIVVLQSIFNIRIISVM